MLRRRDVCFGLLLAASLVSAGCRPAVLDRPHVDGPVRSGAAPSSAPACSAAPHVELQRRLDNDRERYARDLEYSNLGLSPDGRLLAASNDARVLLIDVASGTQVASVHGGPALFNRAGDAIFVAHRDGVVRRSLPDLRETDSYRMPSARQRPPRLMLLPGGDRIAAYNEHGKERLHIWDLRTREPVCSSAAGLGPIAFAATGSSAWGCLNTELAEWSTHDCEILRTWPVWCVAVAVSKDGARVAFGGAALGLFDVATQTLVPHRISHQPVSEMYALENGDILYGSAGLRRFDPLADRPTTSSVLGPSDGSRVLTLALSADHAVAAAFVDHPGQRDLAGERVRTWSLRDGRYLGSMPGAPLMLEPWDIAAHGQTFIAAPPDMFAGLYRIDTGEPLIRGLADRWQLRLSPDGERLVHLVGDTLFVHDGRSGALLREVREVTNTRPSYRDMPGAFVVSPDNGRAFLGDGHGEHTLVALLDGTRIRLREPTIHAGDITAAFSPNSAFLLTRSQTASVSLWAVDTGRRLRRFAGAAAVTFGPQPFSADGRRLALQRGPDTLLIDTVKGDILRRLPGWSQPALSADGRRLLAVDDAGNPAVFDVSSGRRVRDLPVQPARMVRFDAQGHVEITNDHQSSTWSIETGERQSIQPTPRRGQPVLLANGRRLMAEDQALALYSADGTLHTGFAITADRQRRVAWTPDGGWDGDARLLGFSESLTPCKGSPAPRTDLWQAALRSP